MARRNRALPYRRTVRRVYFPPNPEYRCLDNFVRLGDSINGLEGPWRRPYTDEFEEIQKKGYALEYFVVNSFCGVWRNALAGGGDDVLVAPAQTWNYRTNAPKPDNSRGALPYAKYVSWQVLRGRIKTHPRGGPAIEGEYEIDDTTDITCRQRGFVNPRLETYFECVRTGATPYWLPNNPPEPSPFGRWVYRGTAWRKTSDQPVQIATISETMYGWRSEVYTEHDKPVCPESVHTLEWVPDWTPIEVKQALDGTLEVHEPIELEPPVTVRRRKLNLRR